MAAVVQRIDLNLPEFDYASDDIELPAGTQFFFTLCPRNRTGNQLDDQIDGQISRCSARPQFFSRPRDRLRPPDRVPSLRRRPSARSNSGRPRSPVRSDCHSLGGDHRLRPIPRDLPAVALRGADRGWNRLCRSHRVFHSHSQFSGTLLQLQGAGLHNSPDRVERLFLVHRANDRAGAAKYAQPSRISNAEQGQAHSWFTFARCCPDFRVSRRMMRL